MDHDVPAELGQLLAELVGCVEDLDDPVPRAAVERALDGRGDRARDQLLVGGLGRELIDEENPAILLQALAYKAQKRSKRCGGTCESHAEKKTTS